MQNRNHVDSFFLGERYLKHQKGDASKDKIMPSVTYCLRSVFYFWVSIHGLFAQEKPTDADTTLRYENVEGYSNQRGFTRFVYRLFYDPVASGDKPRTAKKITEKVPYTSLQGKVIRNIYIETLDPFGNS
jgi:hypothetical protein